MVGIGPDEYKGIFYIKWRAITKFGGNEGNSLVFGLVQFSGNSHINLKARGHGGVPEGSPGKRTEIRKS